MYALTKMLIHWLLLKRQVVLKKKKSTGSCHIDIVLDDKKEKDLPCSSYTECFQVIPEV